MPSVALPEQSCCVSVPPFLNQLIPICFTQPQAFWYFFGGVVIFGFYATKLFVGVMLEAFLAYKNVDSTGRLMSQEEKQWHDYERRLSQVCLTKCGAYSY